MRLLVTLGILLACHEVRADCAVPQWVGGADRTVLPTTGSLYIYDETLGWGENLPRADVTWTGTPGTSRFTRVGETVVRLDYAGKPGGAMEVHLRAWDETMTYELDARWQAPNGDPRALRYWHHVHEWTCSNADSVMIQIDQRAAAVRARWTYEGKTTEWIVPPHTERSKVVVELGKINCGTTTIPPEQLANGGKLELVAIRFDGSEVPIRMPKLISTLDMTQDPRGMDAAFALVSLDEPKVAAPKHKPSAWIGFAAVLLLTVAPVIGYALVRRSANGCSPALR
jgi:hypothetical protein